MQGTMLYNFINSFIMKFLTRLFFCTFVFVFSSCEPEEMPDQPVINSDVINTGDVYGDTGNEGAVNDKKGT